MRVCADLSVLNFGQLIATGTPDEVQSNRAVLDAYLGGDTDEASAAAAAAAAGVDVGPLDPGALR
jgi:hypothetical protein